MTDAILLLALLVGLELVLGVDNVLVIAVFAGRLPETLRRKARLIGLSLALAARIGMLWLVLALANLTQAGDTAFIRQGPDPSGRRIIPALQGRPGNPSHGRT